MRSNFIIYLKLSTHYLKLSTYRYQQNVRTTMTNNEQNLMYVSLTKTHHQPTTIRYINTKHRVKLRIVNLRLRHGSNFIIYLKRSTHRYQQNVRKQRKKESMLALKNRFSRKSDTMESIQKIDFSRRENRYEDRFRIAHHQQENHTPTNT